MTRFSRYSILALFLICFQAWSLPAPGLGYHGAFGAGVEYQAGRLQLSKSAELEAEVIVYPNGMPNLDGLIYSTATNRTRQTMEVVAIHDQGNKAELGLWDWSCSNSDPCQVTGSQTGWVYDQPLTAISCYTHPNTLPDGSAVTSIHYLNSTTLTDSANEVWQNSVQLWNSCTNAWDMVYQHDFHVPFTDCSQGNETCGWWGPIIETFTPAVQSPKVTQLGFIGVQLTLDGVVQPLDSTNVTWRADGTGWAKNIFTAFSTWVVGNVLSVSAQNPR